LIVLPDHALTCGYTVSPLPLQFACQLVCGHTLCLCRGRCGIGRALVCRVSGCEWRAGDLVPFSFGVRTGRGALRDGRTCGRSEVRRVPYTTLSVLPRYMYVA
jgi:hypothetical protein